MKKQFFIILAAVYVGTMAAMMTVVLLVLHCPGL